MENKSAKNAITLQDEFISKVLGYDTKGSTYYTLLTKAHKALHRELIALGFDNDGAQAAWKDACDVIENARACGARSASECICDPLNFAQ